MYELTPHFDAEVEPGTNILLTGPPLSGKRSIMMDILAAGTDRDEGAIVVTTKDGADRVLRDYEKRTPYEGEPVPEDSPQYDGVLHIDPGYFADRVERAAEAGLRVCVHGQGDLAMDHILDAYEASVDPDEDHRFRIEHAGLTRPEHLERIADLGVCVSSSINFLGADVSRNWVYWGDERMDWTYA
ncbi:MAG: amidohydrolase family protein, partial [Halodesulfurarchaeum sp.]